MPLSFLGIYGFKASQSSPVFTVKTSVINSFGDMMGFYVGFMVQVGDGASYF